MRSNEQAVGQRARVVTRDESMLKLIDVLWYALARFIDPKGDRIGHSSPVDISSFSRKYAPRRASTASATPNRFLGTGGGGRRGAGAVHVPGSACRWCS